MDPAHGHSLPAAEAAGGEWGGGDRVAPPRGVGGAAGRFEIRVRPDEWLVPVISLVFSILCGPR